MRRNLFVFLSLLLAGLFVVPSAFAAAAKFHSASGSVNNAGALVVNFDERGLGNENIDYTLTADASAVFACINGGGKHPQAANKETINSSISASASFEPKNGRVIASISSGAASAGGFSCPSGQRLVLASVSYTNIVLTDTTNGTSTTIADVSRTFFTF
jgi:hypothetical protein